MGIELKLSCDHMAADSCASKGKGEPTLTVRVSLKHIKRGAEDLLERSIENGWSLKGEHLYCPECDKVSPMTGRTIFRAEAKLLKENLPGFKGTTHLYKLKPSLYGEDYVVVTAFNYPPSSDRQNETLIFPSNKQGKVINLGFLEGSYVGDLCHKTALSLAGYTVVK